MSSEALEAGGEVSPDDLAQAFGGSTSAEATATASESGTGVYGMLRSSEPAISPAAVGEQLDLGAEWWQHYGAGFIKMTGAEGTEAWMNLVMGTAILFMSVMDDDEETESTSSGGAEEADGERRYKGPQ